jgi:site-specific DNA recombinase
MLTCGHCGCALTAEIKKDRYVYYHCTGNRGKCPEKYAREEEVARQFGEALLMIRMDDKVISWVINALKDSHKDEKEYHDRIISGLQRQYEKLQSRIDTMYIDKLDGEISKDFYERKSTAWRKEQENILRKIEKHQNANQAYLDDGIKLLELSRNAATLYNNQELAEKRRLLNFVCSNSIWQHGRLYPEYRKPFDMIAEMNIAYSKKKAVFTKENDLFDFWLPSTDSNRGPGG